MVQMSTREFANEPLKAKRLAGEGPVIVTNRGRPELVLLSYRHWRALAPQDVPEDLLEALGDEAVAGIELELPSVDSRPRPVDLS